MSFIARYQAFAKTVTDAPFIFHRIMAYGALAVAVGNRWRMRHFEGGWLTPHLWILLLAESSTFHKSSALRVARRSLGKLQERYLNWDGSHKALVDQFAAQDQGVLIAFEFEQFLGVLQQSYSSGGRGLFTDLYDGELAGSVYKNTGVREWKENLAISFFSASTPAQLTQWLKERDIVAGLLPRFILVHANSQEQRFALPPADDGTMDRELMGLQHYLLSLSGTKGDMVLKPGARKVYEAWYHRMAQIPLDSNRADPWKTRLATVALKLAMLNQIDRNQGTQIEEKAVHDATEFTDMLLHHVGHVCQDELALTAFEEQSKRLRHILTKYEEMYGAQGWIEWGVVLRHMRMPAEQFKKLVETMVQSHQVEWTTKRPQRIRLKPREPGEDDQ
jgi:hypothetical protein